MIQLVCRRWLWLVMLGSCLTGCNKTPSANQSNAIDSSASSELPKVATVKPIRMTLVQKTEQPGQIEAFSRTRIHGKVTAFIDQLLVDIGDRVKGPKRDEQGNVTEPGQLLAVLVAPELIDELKQKQAMILQAKADIDQAQAAVQVAQSIAVSAEANVEEAKAGERRAEADYQRWKSEADRVNVLASSKMVTAKLADETNQQMHAADSSRGEVAAKIRSSNAKWNESKVAITKAEADLRSIKAKLSIAEAEQQRIESLCEYLQIRAPYTGIISERNFDPGSLIQPAQANDENPLFTIVQNDRLRVNLDVPEGDSVLVEQGGKASIRVPALQNRIFEGTVSRTSWALQTGTRTMRCEIEVDNEQGFLRPGMYANIDLIVAQKPDVLTLPKPCILQQDGKPVCLTVSNNGTVIRKILQTGIQSATEIEIVQGLDGSEDVISANAAAFKDGQKVALVPAPK